MNLPIDKAVELTGQVASAIAGVPKSLMPINVVFSKTEVLSVTRIETDTLEVCHPKIVKSKKYLISEKTTIVHQRTDDELDITPL